MTTDDAAAPAAAGEPSSPARVAVIGSGVAGLTAAYVASRTARVTLFEADERLGGHADTHEVDGLAIDTGFIVHNERTYPTLLRLFAELGVETQASEMSMSVSDARSGVEYAGARGLSGLFPTLRSLGSPRYLWMLAEVPRFHHRAHRLLATEPTPRGQGAAGSLGAAHRRNRPTGLGAARASGRDDGAVDPGGGAPGWQDRTGDPGGGAPGCGETLAEFLARGRFSAYFARHFMEPLVAAVWSCDPDRALEYPARYLFQFLEHHGMLGVLGSPQWRTVVGGSREYVRRVAAVLPDVRTGTKVTSVLETVDGVGVTDGNGRVSTFDAVVVATHPDQALAMLAAPTAAQVAVLGALPYSRNTAQLHTDTSLLPGARRARASWNFLRPTSGRGQVTVTYDLTRLMRLPTRRRYLVTLGGTELVDPARVMATMEYAHPLYTPASVTARRRLPAVDTDRVAFAGAYHGWGFHEDGARSGLAAAERLGLTWTEPPAGDARDTQPPAVKATATAATPGQAGTRGAAVPPRVYAATVRHTRRSPWRRTFTHRTHTWLVDLDHLPDHGILGRFESRDHLGDPARSIRGNVEAFVARHGVDLSGGTVLMAANARAFGHCFNPISVHWCYDRAAAAACSPPTCVVVEVHNTYGDRHAYFVRPDQRGRATTQKRMYVSPFHGDEGTYRLAVPAPTDRLRVAVTLHDPDGEVFSASLTGRATGAGAWRAAPAALLGSARIRWHGIRLWARRLPVRPRPVHPPQEGVQ